MKDWSSSKDLEIIDRVTQEEGDGEGTFELEVNLFTGEEIIGESSGFHNYFTFLSSSMLLAFGIAICESWNWSSLMIWTEFEAVIFLLKLWFCYNLFILTCILTRIRSCDKFVYTTTLLYVSMR